MTIVHFVLTSSDPDPPASDDEHGFLAWLRRLVPTPASISDTEWEDAGARDGELRIRWCDGIETRLATHTRRGRIELGPVGERLVWQRRQ